MTYPRTMDAYVSARGRSIAITVLVILQLVALGLAAAAWAVGGGEVGGDLTGAVAAFRGAAVLETLDGLLFIAATIVFLTWVHRSIANLPTLGSMSCRFSPSGAVWSYFIPFVNLVRGHQVMATIWQESQPPAVNENGFYLPRSAALVALVVGAVSVHRRRRARRDGPPSVRRPGSAVAGDDAGVAAPSAHGDGAAVPPHGARRADAAGRAVARSGAPAQRAAADRRRASLIRGYWSEIGPCVGAPEDVGAVIGPTSIACARWSPPVSGSGSRRVAVAAAASASRQSCSTDACGSS